ncbi:MAG: acyltransferase [Nitrospirae bacterium]|nr:acyltransferase [Nitrospirota bacterium]MBI5694795.1 acyltransferase [Nitrospirota bacterium]
MTKSRHDNRSFKHAYRRALAYLCALPFILMVKLKPRNFGDVADMVSLLPMPIGKKIRGEFYRSAMPSFGEGVTIHLGTKINYRDVRVGDNVSLGRYNTIGLADLGDNLLTASGVVILSGRHTHSFDDVDTPIGEQGHGVRRVTIGRDVWIGTNAIVMESVGDGCVIGAGAVVTKPLPPYSVAVGNPARVIRQRGKTETIPV